jgi:chemotaxis protein CheC
MNLTPSQLDVLQEIINIGVGRAANVLNEMIAAHIRLQVPAIKVLSRLDIKQELSARLRLEPISSVRLGFTGTLSGNAHLVFPTDSASKLVAILTDEEIGTPDLDAVKIGTLTEVGNIVINGAIGSISNLLKQQLRYSMPAYIEGSIEQLLTNGSSSINATILLAQTRFTIDQLQVEGDIILFFNLGSFDILLTSIEQYYGE